MTAAVTVAIQRAWWCAWCGHKLRPVALKWRHKVAHCGPRCRSAWKADVRKSMEG